MIIFSARGLVTGAAGRGLVTGAAGREKRKGIPSLAEKEFGSSTIDAYETRTNSDTFEVH